MMEPMSQRSGMNVEVGQPEGVAIFPPISELRQLLIEASRDGVQKLLAGAVIRGGEGILLVERVPEDFLGGLFELPSGHVDSGETLLDGLVREVREETGLRIREITKDAGSFDYKSGSGKLARQFNFAVSVEPGEVTLNPQEHASFVWCHSLTQLESLKMSAESRRIVARVMNWS